MLPTKRKPREKPINHPSGPAKRQKCSHDATTSVQLQQPTTRKNLTLADWLLVYAYVDTHPDVPQADIVEHFRTRHEGALIFTQGTLSRKLSDRASMEARANDNPSALSSKRPRIVTRPDVERALILWVRDMEGRGETVSGPMLREKRKSFEDWFQVPEAERLHGESWVQSFRKTYKIREIRRHGEAASVGQEAVEAERIRCRQLLASYAPRDRFNMDEIVFNPFAPPDRDLATKQLSGKKKERFRISIGIACNADGSEKLELFFVGKAAKPRCFKKQTPEQRGFYYRNNKMAWMTSEFFEEWVKRLDLQMKQKNRHIILLVDNSSGHSTSYEPSNVRLAYFEPNMMPFVQPCDAGIIHSFKMLYRRNYNSRAVRLDEDGENEIYNVDLLEAMVMAKDAWNFVTPDCIKNCWNHTRIQPESYADGGLGSLAELPLSSQSTTPHADPLAWKIIHEFATTDLSLPNAECRLEAHLGSRFIDADWRAALQAVMSSEGDTEVALTAIKPLEEAAKRRPGLEIQISRRRKDLPLLESAEKELMQAITTLKSRNRIFGTLPTVDEILDPPEEAEIRDPKLFSAGEKGDEEIVAMVKHKMAVASGEIIEIDSEDEDDGPALPCITRKETIGLCKQLMGALLEQGEAEEILELSKPLCRFQARLQQHELASLKQVTIDSYFTA